MKWITLFEKKLFYKKILILIMIVSILLISIFSLVTYFNIQKVVLENEYESNTKLLQQIMVNINYMDDSMNKIIYPLFLNKMVTSVMYNNEVDYIDAYKTITSMKSNILTSNSFIKAITIYNSKTKMLYSTDGFHTIQESGMKDLLKSIRNLPIGYPILRKRGNENVISYVSYEYRNTDEELSGVLIVDTNIDWIVKNMKAIQMIQQTKDDQIFLLDNKQQYVQMDSGETQFMTDLKNIFASHVNGLDTSDLEQGFFKQKLNGKDYLITYMPLPKTKWVLLKVQPYHSVFKNTQRLKYLFMVITFLFLILVLIISVLVSNYIYRPLGKLVRHVTSSGMNNIPESNLVQDEFTFLNDVYTYSNEQLMKYKAQMQSNRNMKKELFLKKIFSYSFLINKEELEAVKEDCNLDIVLNAKYIICLLKIDKYKEFQEKYPHDDKMVYKFAMANLFREILSESYKNEAVDLSNDSISILICVEEDMLNMDRLIELIRKGQELYYQYFTISVTATFSDVEKDLRNMSSAYDSAVNNSMYRLIFGNRSIITEDIVRCNNSNIKVGYSESDQKKLREAIKMEDVNKSENIVKSILQDISSQSYNNIIFSVMNLVNTIKETFDEINFSRVVPIHFNFNTVVDRILTSETFDELYEEIRKLLSAISQKDNEEDNKKKILVDMIRKMIDENYFKQELCLQSIAETMNMSKKYLSRVFKVYNNISIPDYINQVRLGKALELLENTKLGIGEIAVKIGMENENYFYTLFKKNYGVTPREYFQSQIIRTNK